VHPLVVAVPAFLASAVEAVEAMTIILAVGVTRQWRSAIAAGVSTSSSETSNPIASRCSRTARRERDVVLVITRIPAPISRSCVKASCAPSIGSSPT